MTITQREQERHVWQKQVQRTQRILRFAQNDNHPTRTIRACLAKAIATVDVGVIGEDHVTRKPLYA
jgi:hypothetical protein